MDRDKIAQTLFRVAENASAEIPSDPAIDFIIEMLEDDGITASQFEYAANFLIKTKKDFYGKMPTYGEYYEIIKGNTDQIAEKEAQAVIALINYEGRYADYKHRLTPETITTINNRFGGWDSLCSTLEASKFNWFVKEFKEAYTASKTRVPQIRHDQAKNLLTNIPKLKAV